MLKIVAKTSAASLSDLLVKNCYISGTYGSKRVSRLVREMQVNWLDFCTFQVVINLNFCAFKQVVKQVKPMLNKLP